MRQAEPDRALADASAAGRPSPARLDPLYRHVEAAGTPRRVWLAAIGFIAALPSLAWAFGGTAFVHDDWWLSAQYSVGGSARWSAFWLGATSSPARPGAAAYYTVTYALLGTNPVLHTLAQALINAAAGVLVYLVAERLWRTEIAVWVALVYVMLPNRGSTRLWAAVATNPLAVVLLLVGVLVLLRGRTLLAGLLFALAVLTYEGVLGLAGLALVYWVIQDFSARWRRAAQALVPVLAAAAAIFLMSPKRSGAEVAQGGIDGLISSQFGSGIFEWSAVAGLGFMLIVLGLAVGLLLPSQRQPRYRPVLLGGLAIFLAAAAPFVLVHWPIQTAGFFDRANGVIGLGTAVLIGTLLAWLVDLVPGRVGLLPAAVVLLIFLTGNVADVEAYRDAVRDGDVLLAHVLADVPPTARVVRIVPPPDAPGGVAQFPSGGNLTEALLRARGDRVLFWSIPGVEPAPPPADALCYDRISRVLGACPTPDQRGAGG